MEGKKGNDGVGCVSMWTMSCVTILFGCFSGSTFSTVVPLPFAYHTVRSTQSTSVRQGVAGTFVLRQKLMKLDWTRDSDH